jgi:hypothetical protein
LVRSFQEIEPTWGFAVNHKTAHSISGQDHGFVIGYGGQKKIEPILKASQADAARRIDHAHG